MVLMMKPRVGLTVLTSSCIIFFTIVVFPALSRPLNLLGVEHSEDFGCAHSIRILMSLSFNRAFLSIDSIVLLTRVNVDFGVWPHMHSLRAETHRSIVLITCSRAPSHIITLDSFSKVYCRVYFVGINHCGMNSQPSSTARSTHPYQPKLLSSPTDHRLEKLSPNTKRIIFFSILPLESTKLPIPKRPLQ